MKMLTIYSTVMDLLTQRTNEHDVGISKRTLACDYIPSVRLFNKFLGRTATVHDLQTKTFNEFRNWLIDASGNANRTQVGRLTSIKMLMNYAINEGLIDRQYKFKSIRIVRKNPTSWGNEEVSKLITAAMQSSTARNLLGDTGIEKGLYFATSIAVGWDTALRRGDVLALKFEDIVMQKDSFGSVVILQSETQNLIKCELKPDTIQFLQQIRCLQT